MRTFLVTTALLLMSIPVSVQAHSDRGWRDEMSAKLEEWIEYAEDLNYRVIEAEVFPIRGEDILRFELGPGTYHAYAESSDNIDDLDMVVYDARGRELDSDTMADNYPIADFTISSRQTVTFEVSVYSSDNRSRRGQYAFVLARERRDFGRDGWGGCRDPYWDDFYYDDWRSRDRDWDSWGWDRGYGYGSREIENRLDDLIDFARDNDMVPVRVEVGMTSGTETYEMSLGRGSYAVLAAAGDCIEDLDLRVTDSGGWTLGEDIELDAEPQVWFDLRGRTNVEIEVEAWTFARGCDREWICMVVCRRSR